MATLYRWKDNKGNASEPMTFEAAKLRDKKEHAARNPHGFLWPAFDYQTWIHAIEVTDREYALYSN